MRGSASELLRSGVMALGWLDCSVLNIAQK